MGLFDSRGTSVHEELVVTQQMLAFVVDMLGGSLTLTPSEMQDLLNADFEIESYEDQTTFSRTIRVQKRTREPVPPDPQNLVGFLAHTVQGVAAGSPVFRNPYNPTVHYSVNPRSNEVIRFASTVQVLTHQQANQAIAQRAINSGGSTMFDLRPHIAPADPTQPETDHPA